MQHRHVDRAVDLRSVLSVMRVGERIRWFRFGLSKKSGSFRSAYQPR